MTTVGSHHGSRGFTLVETMVALLLLLLGLTLSAQLLIEAGSSMARSQAEAVHTPPSRLALARFAVDVREARPPFAGGGAGPLVLQLPGETVRWQLVDDCLERSSTSAGATAGSSRRNCVLSGVSAWSWRAVSSRRLQLTVAVSKAATVLGASRLAELRRRPTVPSLATVSVTAAARSSDQRGRW